MNIEFWVLGLGAELFLGSVATLLLLRARTNDRWKLAFGLASGYFVVAVIATGLAVAGYGDPDAILHVAVLFGLLAAMALVAGFVIRARATG